MTSIENFDAVVCDKTTVLVLGSMPSVKSLAQQQYYAHTRNAFWPIMRTLLSIEEGLTYEEQLKEFIAKGLGLWDVYASCERKGSLDSDIVRATASFSDIAGLLKEKPSIKTLVCNGGEAQKALRRYIKSLDAEQQALIQGLSILDLPSTSPANAAMSFEAKLAAWQQITQ